MCKQKHDSRKIFNIQSIMTQFFANKIESDTIENILIFLRSHILKALPKTNQFVMELKLFSIWHVGNIKDKQFKLEDYIDKEVYCVQVIDVLDKLNTSNSILSGKLYFELYKTRLMLQSLNHETVRSF